MCVNVVSMLNVGVPSEGAVLPSLGKGDCSCLQKVAPRWREKSTSEVESVFNTLEFCSVAGSLLRLSINIYWGYRDLTDLKWELKLKYCVFILIPQTLAR